MIDLRPKTSRLEFVIDPDLDLNPGAFFPLF